jgi:hypothetical protein
METDNRVYGGAVLFQSWELNGVRIRHESSLGMQLEQSGQTSPDVISDSASIRISSSRGISGDRLRLKRTLRISDSADRRG